LKRKNGTPGPYDTETKPDNQSQRDSSRITKNLTREALHRKSMNKNNTISCSPWFLLIPQTCAIKYYRNKVHGLLFIPHICIQEKRHSTYEFLPQKSPLSLAMHTPLSMPPSYVQDSCLQGNRRDNYIHDARNKWQQMNQPKQNNTHHSSIPHAYANSIHQSTTDKESKTRLS